ncbi:hypothetical protein BDZ94DRAFT_1238622 [Collybia nuda]|uniref:Uncharacterized protein n=1 Tax=Collybia nuda TaxID=64659 RepID=A0A9P6CGR0_9AGAR|nr:hypothetical protein BDZ94DRAFT_1238622 [Collybia nuda]
MSFGTVVHEDTMDLLIQEVIYTFFYGIHVVLYLHCMATSLKKGTPTRKQPVSLSLYTLSFLLATVIEVSALGAMIRSLILPTTGQPLDWGATNIVNLENTCFYVEKVDLDHSSLHVIGIFRIHKKDMAIFFDGKTQRSKAASVLSILVTTGVILLVLQVIYFPMYYLQNKLSYVSVVLQSVYLGFLVKPCSFECFTV